ncbi:MAG: ABC transporter permease [Opitutales bacterium]|nr:ABC transporter permease [Opitutales bacterium]
MMWRKITTVALEEYRRVVVTKSFLIGLLIPIVIYGGMAVAMVWMGDKADLEDRRVAVLDHTGALAEPLEEAARRRNAGSSVYRDGRQVAPKFYIETVAPRDGVSDDHLVELADRVRAEEIFAVLEIGPAYVERAGRRGEDYLRYFSDRPTEVDLPGWLRREVENATERFRFAAAGLDEREVRAMLSHPSIERKRLPERGEDGQVRFRDDLTELAFFVPLGVVLLMFFSIQMTTPILLNSVIEEKMYRISEVLLSNLTPFQLFAGKLLGGMLVGVTFSIAYLVSLGLSLRYFDAAGYAQPGLYVGFIVFLLLGLLAFGAMFGGVSAACQDLKDAQNFAGAVVIVLVAPMILAVVMIQAPDSGVAVALSMIPPFSPMMMTMRLAIPPVPPLWQLSTAVAANLAFGWLCVWLASRVFRIGILSTGKTPGFRELLRWMFRDE